MSTLDQTRPDLEDLAAFVDGRLVGELRQPVEERLARDPAYYEVFLETLRFREENEAVESPAERRRVSLRWQAAAAAAAAAAVVVIAVGLWRLASPTDSMFWVERRDAERIVTLGGWDTLGWSTMRDHSGLHSGLTREQLVFRLGVRIFDLRVALLAGDLSQTREARGRLNTLFRALRLSEVVQLNELAKGLVVAQETRSGVSISDLEDQALALEASLYKSLGRKSEEGLHLTLGRWTQATRLAALSEDRRAFADYLARAPQLDHRPGITAALARLEEGAGKIDSPDGWRRVVAELDALAKALGG